MKYGFIGLGNMAGAIITGMYQSGRFREDDIYGYAPSEATRQKMSQRFGVKTLNGNAEVVAASDFVFLAVKPQFLNDVIPQIRDLMKDKVLGTIVTGKDFNYYASEFGDIPVVRVVPNINSKVQASLTAVCANDKGQQYVEAVKEIFETVGTVKEIPERQLTAFNSIAGASPAFAYLYIDALARAGLKNGLPKALALEVAAEAVKGSCELILKSGEHPMALVDQVTSPGGTTIEGIYVLQKKGFEDAVHEAIDAVIAKDEKIRKG